jgi:hypothetical protein
MPPYDIPPKIVYEQGGGMNRGLPATEIEQNEVVTLRNFYTFGKKNIRRGGVRRVLKNAYFEQITSFFPYVHSAGDRKLIIGATSSFGICDDPTDPDLLITQITNDTGIFIPYVNRPWVMIQYNDSIYAAREGDGKMYLVGTGIVRAAGIAAPTTAPGIVAGAAGALAAGDYQAVYTYFDSATGVEGNPSPASTVLTLGAGGLKINYSAIADPPSTARIDTKRIYRTLIDQVGEYYYVGSVPVGTTTFTEDLLPDAMGDPVLFDNNLPRTDLRWITIWNERCFGTDGIDLFLTNLFNPEGWTNDIYPIYKEDGHKIRVLYKFGDRLIIGKTNKVHFLVGTDRSTFRLQTLSDKHGVMSGHSMRSAEGNLFWYGSGKNFYRSDGTSTIAIGDIKIRDLLDAIPDHLQDQITAEVFPALSQYIASIPNGSGSNNNRDVVVYNYRTDSWSLYRHPGNAPQYLAEYFTATYGRQLFGTLYDGYIYEMYDPDQTDDYGSPIDAFMLTRQEDGGSLMAKGLRRVHLLCTTAAELVTLSAYRDGRAVPSASRDVSLNVDARWKVANLSTLKDPGSTVQLGIAYTGTTAIEIEAVGLEIDPIERFSGQPQ